MGKIANLTNPFMKELILLLAKGGPAMWALLFCTVLLLWVSLEKAYFLWKSAGASPLTYGQIKSGKKEPGCQRLTYQLLVGEVEIQQKFPQKTKPFRDMFMIKAERELSRGLSILATISVISPFIGLFGTVLGIMHAFFQVAQKGNMTPAVVGAGIAEALIATSFGLLVAIISVILYNVFKVFRDRELEDLDILQNETDLVFGGKEHETSPEIPAAL